MNKSMLWIIAIVALIGLPILVTVMNIVVDVAKFILWEVIIAFILGLAIYFGARRSVRR